MATGSSGGPGDFESLARQYWNAWGESMRQGGMPRAGMANATTAGMPGWQDAVDWWSKLAHGGRGEANAAVERFNAQAKQWYGQMQQVAAQFAGQNASAADITSEWKRALGAMGENPFPELFRSMRGQGQQGLDQWIEDASPYLDAWRRESSSWLGMPAFGQNREQQERWQSLAQAQIDYQQRNSAYNALMMKAVQGAYALFEYKLAEREAPGRQLTSARALFDLWIDAAEEAYAEIALSPEFREVYGALVNAQMRVRAGVQREVEQIGAMFGMPTRSELDGTHRKIAELERALRRMRDSADGGVEAGPKPNKASLKSRRPAGSSRPASGTGTSKKPAAKRAPAKVAKKFVSKRAVAKTATKTPLKPGVAKSALQRIGAKPTVKRVTGGTRATAKGKHAVTSSSRKTLKGKR